MSAALETLMLALRRRGEAGRILFLGAEPHTDLQRVIGWQPMKPLANRCEAAGMQLTSEPQGEFDTVLFLPGKSKDEILAGYSRAYDLMAPDGMLIVALPNTAGASRFEKELSKATELLFSISKNKCRAFAVKKSEGWDAQLLKRWETIAQPRVILGTDYWVAPGVFSAERIDPGSRLLKEYLPASLRGEVADLGAGWGYLSDVALAKSPKISQIDLFEADSRALECAHRNVPDKAVFHWHDVTGGLPSKYDHIIMNPPFHTAQTKDLDLGKSFLTVAAASLKRRGSLHLVANRQLPYESHLESLGLRSRILTENHAYKVIFAS
ncbi:MAG: class I SAM-dependent methyltransferase [Akkermansiaceae bacterium]